MKTQILLAAISILLSLASPRKIHDFESLYESNYTFIKTPISVIITSQEDWNRFWAIQIDEPVFMPAPNVDFAEEMVIARFAGPRPSTDYFTCIAVIRTENENTDIEVVESQYHQDKIKIEEKIVYPCHFVKVKKIRGPITFRIIN